MGSCCFPPLAWLAILSIALAGLQPAATMAREDLHDSDSIFDHETPSRGVSKMEAIDTGTLGLSEISDAGILETPGRVPTKRMPNKNRSSKKPGQENSQATASASSNLYLDEIREDARMKMTDIMDDFDEMEIDFQSGEHKQGEHVINKGIIKFFRNINEEHPGCYDKDELVTLDEEIDQMKVKAEDKEHQYTNANSVIFGRYLKALKDYTTTPPRKQDIRRIAHLMCTHEIYVDNEAKKDWVKGQGKEIKEKNNKIIKAKDKVEKMLEHLSDCFP